MAPPAKKGRTKAVEVAVPVDEIVPDNEKNSVISNVTVRAKKTDNASKKKAHKLESKTDPSLVVTEPINTAVVESATNGFTRAAPKRQRQRKNYAENTPTPVKRKPAPASKVAPSKRVRKASEIEENFVPAAKEVLPEIEPEATLDEIVGVAKKIKKPNRAVSKARVPKKARKADESDDLSSPAKVKKIAENKNVEAVSDAEADVIPTPAIGKKNAKTKAGTSAGDALPKTIAAEQADSLVSHTIKQSAKPKADPKEKKPAKTKRAIKIADPETTEKEDELPKRKRAKPKPKEAIIEAASPKLNDKEESSKATKSKQTAKAEELKVVEPAPKAKPKRAAAKPKKAANGVKKVIEPLVTGDDEQIDLPVAELAAVVQETNGVVETGTLKGKAKRVLNSKKPAVADVIAAAKTVEPLVKLTDPKTPFTTKITSWNVAGLRALAKKGGFDYIIAEKPDIFCLQEIKCLHNEVPPESDVQGYHKYWNSKPGGHAGVALYSRVMPHNVEYGLEQKDEHDGRVITAEYLKYFVVCVYVPNAGRKLVNLAERLKWDTVFQEHIVRLNKRKPIIICGDMNVSHTEIDLANPKSNTKSAGFTPEERASMSKMLSLGFVDTFRHLYPNKLQAYTYWTYMANARSRNIGWRLDYFISSEKLVPMVVDVLFRDAVMGSDHCPITLFLNL